MRWRAATPRSSASTARSGNWPTCWRSNAPRPPSRRRATSATLALDGANRSRATLEGQLAALVAERDGLGRQLTERTGERDRAQADLAQRSTERDRLARDLAGTEARATATAADLARLDVAVEARRTVAADKETIEAQLRDLARLARDLEALRTLRADLERRVANLSATLAETTRIATDIDTERARRARELAEQGATLDAARTRVAGLEEQVRRREQTLGETERAGRRPRAARTRRAPPTARRERQVRELASAVSERDARIRALSGALDDQTARRRTDQREAQQTAGALRDRTRELEARLSTEQERTLLAQRTIEENAIRLRALFQQAERGERELDAERQAGAAARDAMRVLAAELEGLKTELAKLNAVLEASEVRNRDQQVQIVDLGSRLNQALATKVEVIALPVGILRADAEPARRWLDVEIVGDRFVFPAEVLFAVGSPDLNDTGKARMADLARTLKEIAATIPPDLTGSWRVDGHTDRTRVRSPLFRNNWDLSAARAINVVQFLIEQGIPPNRLAATGFGEFQPIDPANNDDAYRRNRRIELKITER